MEGHYWIECKINRDLDRMRTTPNQEFFTLDKPTAYTEQDANFNDLKGLINKMPSPNSKPYTRGSEPENED
jgi:hypothetical protein